MQHPTAATSSHDARWPGPCNATLHQQDPASCTVENFPSSRLPSTACKRSQKPNNIYETKSLKSAIWFLVQQYMKTTLATAYLLTEWFYRHLADGADITQSLRATSLLLSLTGPRWRCRSQDPARSQRWTLGWASPFAPHHSPRLVTETGVRTKTHEFQGIFVLQPLIKHFTVANVAVKCLKWS